MGHNLTKREMSIFHLVQSRLTNKEIGSQLNISERTAKFHVSNILSKLRVENRIDLILMQYQTPLDIWRMNNVS